MAIRPLIIDPQGDPKVALQEISSQWQEMSGVVNDLLNHLSATRSGKVYSDTDIGIDSTTLGVILKDTAGHYWRVNVSTTGALVTADLGTTKP